MATFFANFMPWIALFWAISFLFFVDKIRSDALGADSFLEDGAITHYDAGGEGDEDSIDQSPDDFGARLAAREYRNLIPTGAQAIPLITLIVTCLCILTPIRSIIKRWCIAKDENARDPETDYKHQALGFPTDYDKENPLTKKQG